MVFPVTLLMDDVDPLISAVSMCRVIVAVHIVISLFNFTVGVEPHLALGHRVLSQIPDILSSVCCNSSLVQFGCRALGFVGWHGVEARIIVVVIG